jgi:hypothetical protein
MNIVSTCRRLSRILIVSGILVWQLGMLPQAYGQVTAVLENPQPGSVQNGVGVVSGWVCQAQKVEVEIDGRVTLPASYGTGRRDTRGACGDENNGYGLLVNWNLLTDGLHRIRVLADGVEVSVAEFAVTTLGLGQFAVGLQGFYELPNFPQTGQVTLIRWQEGTQSFVIVKEASAGNTPGNGSNKAGARLENPQAGSVQSGVGVVSGWVCQAQKVEVEIDGRVTLPAAYGTGRRDTQSACGDENNGYGLLVNWNILADGPHRIRVLANGVEVSAAEFTVATLGLGQFPVGLQGAYALPDFPQAGKVVLVQWQEAKQNFAITTGTETQVADAPQLQVTPATIDFGVSQPGEVRRAALTVTNLGKGNLVGIVDTATPFTVEEGQAFSLGAGRSQAIVVSFGPATGGTHAGNVIVNSNVSSFQIAVRAQTASEPGPPSPTPTSPTPTNPEPPGPTPPPDPPTSTSPNGCRSVTMVERQQAHINELEEFERPLDGRPVPASASPCPL